MFPNEDGTVYNNINTALELASKRAALPDTVGMHQLRHAFCSHALMAGVDPRTVMKWMGHQDLRTTLNYAHVSPGHEKLAIQRLQYKNSHYMDTRARME